MFSLCGVLCGAALILALRSGLALSTSVRSSLRCHFLHFFSVADICDALTLSSILCRSRGKSRFVDEVYIPSADLLTGLQKAEGGESCLGQSKTSIQETGAAHVSSQNSIKETCADTLSISPSQASFFAQRTIPSTEEKWKVIPASSSYGGALSVAVSKMVTRMVRHYDQDNDNLTQHFTGTRQGQCC